MKKVDSAIFAISLLTGFFIFAILVSTCCGHCFDYAVQVFTTRIVMLIAAVGTILVGAIGLYNSIKK